MASGAKAQRSLQCIYGTTEVMPCYKIGAQFGFSASCWNRQFLLLLFLELHESNKKPAAAGWLRRGVWEFR
jgi:hypothetical protein